MAKNLWNLGLFILLVLFVIISGLFIYSLIVGTSVEAKIAELTLLATIIIFVAQSLIKHYNDRSKETIEEYRTELKLKANEKDMMLIKENLEATLYQHIKLDEDRYKEHKEYDMQRYEEIHALIEKTSEVVYKVESLIMEGKIKIVKK